MLTTLADVVFFGPGLWTLLLVYVIVGVVLAVFRDTIDPLIRRILVAVLVIVLVLWLLNVAFGSPVWVHS